MLEIGNDVGLEAIDYFASYDDKVFFKNVFMGKEPSDYKEAVYGIDLKTNEQTQLTLKTTVLGLEQGAIEIIAALNNDLLVKEISKNVEQKMVSESGNEYTSTMLCSNYAIISKENYWNSKKEYNIFEDVWFLGG